MMMMHGYYLLGRTSTTHTTKNAQSAHTKRYRRMVERRCWLASTRTGFRFSHGRSRRITRQYFPLSRSRTVGTWYSLDETKCQRVRRTRQVEELQSQGGSTHAHADVHQTRAHWWNQLLEEVRGASCHLPAGWQAAGRGDQDPGRRVAQLISCVCAWPVARPGRTGNWRQAVKGRVP